MAEPAAPHRLSDQPPHQPPRPELLTLAVLAVAATGLWWATPRLIVPFRPEQPWYESAATFPRLGLLIVALGGVVEAVRRWRGTAQGAADELDSSAASLPRIAAALALFVGYAVAVPMLGFGVSSGLFLAAAGRAVGLGWRATLGLAVPLALALWLLFVQLLKVAFGHGLLF